MSLSTLLNSIQQNVFRIGGPVLITIGSIGCMLNLMVFTKDNLRKNPCAICFIAVNVTNFVYFYLGLLPSVLAVGYNIDPSSSSIIFCRFRYYIAVVLACWESSYLILASIDRTLITSTNAGTRKRSTRRSVIVSIIGIGLFWLIFHIHAFFLTDIIQFAPNYFVCYYRPGIYTTIMTFYGLIFNGFLPPLLMAIFGLCTMKNIRQVRRVMPPNSLTNTGTITVGRPHAIQAKDQQLVRMLLLDIISFVICKCPSTLFILYQQITRYNEKSAEQQLTEQAILYLTYFLYFIENSIGFYTNVLISKTFRTELKRIC